MLKIISGDLKLIRLKTTRDSKPLEAILISGTVNAVCGVTQLSNQGFLFHININRREKKAQIPLIIHHNEKK